jgi:type IX secretion system PorP/SprF family membrane protein
MKRKLIITAMGLFGFTALFGQQQALFSQYMLNDYVLNPAVAGTQSFIPIRSVLRSQWTGIEGNPNTQTLSVHARVGKRTGVGGYIFHDEIGPLVQTGFSGSYAYHVRFENDRQLSLGIGAMAYSYRIKSNELNFDSQNTGDNVLYGESFKAYYPNFSFGAYYYTEKFYAGVSVPELMQTKVSSSQEFFILKQMRHYYLTTGYRINMGKNFSIEPSTLVKYVQAAPLEVDLSAKFTAYEKFWLGASYRTNDAVVAFVGFKLKESWNLSYSYDITMTPLSNFTKGSHEIMLGYDIIKKEKKPSI